MILGDPDRATELFAEAHTVAQQLGTDGNPLLGAAAACRQKRHRPASRLERADAERAERRARGLLGDREFDAELRDGASRPDDVAGELEGVAAQR